MTLAEAVAAVTSEFPQADAATDDKLYSDNCLNLTSGGLRTDRDVEPALYASRELAVEAWRREALAILRERAPRSIVLVDGPHLDKWHMTVADKMNTQRVAEPRWSVTSRIGLIGPGEGAEPVSVQEQIEALAARVAVLEAKEADRLAGLEALDRISARDVFGSQDAEKVKSDDTAGATSEPTELPAGPIEGDKAA